MRKGEIKISPVQPQNERNGMSIRKSQLALKTVKTSIPNVKFIKLPKLEVFVINLLKVKDFLMYRDHIEL